MLASEYVPVTLKTINVSLDDRCLVLPQGLKTPTGTVDLAYHQEECVAIRIRVKERAVSISLGNTTE
jgi:hypothetical protein